MDPVSAASNIIGITVPAIHGARLLLDDIRRITQAPARVASLIDDLIALEATIESLQAVEEEQWLYLGEKVLEHARAVITTCDSACRIFNADLQHWTRRSRDGKLAWRDKANIGFFKESQVKAMSSQLQSAKITCANLVGIATLHSSMRHHEISKDTKDVLLRRETDLSTFSEDTAARLNDVEACLAQLRLADSGIRDEDESEDLASAITQLEEENTALRASHALVPGLTLQLNNIAHAQVTVNQRSATTVTFGKQNQGIQVGVNNASINIAGFHFGGSKSAQKSVDKD